MEKFIGKFLVFLAVCTLIGLASAFAQTIDAPSKQKNGFEVDVYINGGDTAIIKTKVQNIPDFITLMKDGKIVYGRSTWDVMIAPKNGVKSADRIKTYRVYRLLDGSTYSIPKSTDTALVRQIYALIKARDDQ